MLSAFAPAKIASETFLSTMGLSYTRYTLLLVFAASLILESHARLKGESPFSPPGELSLSLEELPVRELRRTKPERNDNRKVPKNAEGPWKKPKIPKAEKTAGKVSKMENARNNDDVKKPKEDKAVPAQQSSKFPKSTERAKTKPRSDDEKESSSTEASSNKAANGEYGPPSEKDGDGHREKATKEGKPEKTKKDEKDDHEKKTVKSGRDKADEEEKLEKSNKDNEKQAVKTKKAKTENEGKGGEESGEREKKEGSAQKQPRKKTEEDEEDLPDDFEAPVEGNAFENPFGKIDKPTDTDPQPELTFFEETQETKLVERRLALLAFEYNTTSKQLPGEIDYVELSRVTSHLLSSMYKFYLKDIKVVRLEKVKLEGYNIIAPRFVQFEVSTFFHEREGIVVPSQGQIEAVVEHGLTDHGDFYEQYLDRLQGMPFGTFASTTSFRCITSPEEFVLLVQEYTPDTPSVQDVEEQNIFFPLAAAAAVASLLLFIAICAYCRAKIRKQSDADKAAKRYRVGTDDGSSTGVSDFRTGVFSDDETHSPVGLYGSRATDEDKALQIEIKAAMGALEEVSLEDGENYNGPASAVAQHNEILPLQDDVYAASTKPRVRFDPEVAVVEEPKKAPDSFEVLEDEEEVVFDEDAVTRSAELFPSSEVSGSDQNSTECGKPVWAHRTFQKQESTSSSTEETPICLPSAKDEVPSDKFRLLRTAEPEGKQSRQREVSDASKSVASPSNGTNLQQIKSREAVQPTTKPLVEPDTQSAETPQVASFSPAWAQKSLRPISRSNSLEPKKSAARVSVSKCDQDGRASLPPEEEENPVRASRRLPEEPSGSSSQLPTDTSTSGRQDSKTSGSVAYQCKKNRIKQPEWKSKNSPIAGKAKSVPAQTQQQNIELSRLPVEETKNVTVEQSGSTETGDQEANQQKRLSTNSREWMSKALKPVDQTKPNPTEKERRNCDPPILSGDESLCCETRLNDLQNDGEVSKLAKQAPDENPETAIGRKPDWMYKNLKPVVQTKSTSSEGRKKQRNKPDLKEGEILSTEIPPGKLQEDRKANKQVEDVDSIKKPEWLSKRLRPVIKLKPDPGIMKKQERGEDGSKKNENIFSDDGNVSKQANELVVQKPECTSKDSRFTARGKEDNSDDTGGSGGSHGISTSISFGGGNETIDQKKGNCDKKPAWMTKKLRPAPLAKTQPAESRQKKDDSTEEGRAEGPAEGRKPVWMSTNLRPIDSRHRSTKEGKELLAPSESPTEQTVPTADKVESEASAEMESESVGARSVWMTKKLRPNSQGFSVVAENAGKISSSSVDSSSAGLEDTETTDEPKIPGVAGTVYVNTSASNVGPLVATAMFDVDNDSLSAADEDDEAALLRTADNILNSSRSSRIPKYTAAKQSPNETEAQNVVSSLAVEDQDVSPLETTLTRTKNSQVTEQNSSKNIVRNEDESPVSVGERALSTAPLWMQKFKEMEQQKQTD